MMTKEQLAVKVLRYASIRDDRIQFSDAKCLAWAQLFKDQKVWLTEALEAVDKHYRKPNAFPIMAGDVIAYCESQPVYSSADHASQFLAEACRHPYSDWIENHTGVRPPVPEGADALRGDEQKQYLIEKLTDWVLENHDRLVRAILELRYDAVKLDAQ